MRIAAGAVQQEDGIIDVAGGVAMRRTQREVVQFEFRQGFAAAEFEVGERDPPIFRGPFGCGLGGTGIRLGASWRARGKHCCDEQVCGPGFHLTTSRPPVYEVLRMVPKWS